MANLLFAPENLTRSGLKTPEGVSLHAGWYHGLRVASGQHQGRALTLLRADCSEDVDRTRPLIMRGPGPGAPSGPAPRDLVLLADAGLVLPPQLDRGALREARPDRLQGGG